jgi:hypothetical protein
LATYLNPEQKFGNVFEIVFDFIQSLAVFAPTQNFPPIKTLIAISTFNNHSFHFYFTFEMC